MDCKHSHPNLLEAPTELDLSLSLSKMTLFSRLVPLRLAVEIEYISNSAMFIETVFSYNTPHAFTTDLQSIHGFPFFTQFFSIFSTWVITCEI